MATDPLQLLLQTSRKRAVASLNTDGDKQFANPSYGTILPLEVALVVALTNPQGVRVFSPQSWDGWSNIKVGIGNGFVPPVAGTWYLLSGIALTSGTVTSGKRFKIVTFEAGDNFTNIGAGSNASGVVFIASGTTPTTWSNGSTLEEATANLEYDATAADLATALNATAWITAGGGVTVTGENLFYFVTWITDGVRAEMVGFAGNLAPLSIAEVATLIDGDSNLQEVQTVRVFQNCGAFVVLSTDSPAATVDVDEVTVGGGGFNAKYRVSLTTPPYDGAFSLVIAGLESAMIAWNVSAADLTTALENINATSGLLISGQKYTIVTFAAGDDFANVGGTNVSGNVFTASGTTPTDWTNGSVLTPVGAGNVAVTKEADNQYLIVFQAALANTDIGTITGDASALQVIPFKTGTLNLDTAGIQILLGTATSISTFISCTATPPGESYPQELYRQNITLVSAIIDPGSAAPPPFLIFYTAAQVDSFLALKANIASPTFTGTVTTDDLEINGDLDGAPPGGALDLSNVTLTLPSGLTITADTGWTANADAGTKTTVIPSGTDLNATEASLNMAVPSSDAGTVIRIIGEKVKAIESALANSLRPNA